MSNQVQIAPVSRVEAIPLQGLNQTPVPRQSSRSLYASILKLTESAGQRDQFIMQLLQQTVATTNALGGAYFLRDSKEELVLGPRLVSRELMARAPGINTELGEIAKQTAATGSVQVVQNTTIDNRATISVPVSRNSGSNEVLVLCVDVAPARIESLVVLTQLVAGYVNFWGARATAIENRREAEISAAVVELIESLHRQADQQAIHYTLANELSALAGCERVAVGVPRAVDGRHRVSAISGLSDFDKRTELVDAVEAVFADAVATVGVAMWPPVPGVSDSDAVVNSRLKCHERLARLMGVSHVASVPLADAANESAGTVVLWWDEESTALTDTTRFRVNILNAISAPVGVCLGRLQRGRMNSPLRKSHRVRRWLMSLGLLVALGALVIPVDHRVKATTVMEPVASRHVAAPFDAIISESTVEPGQRVEAGAVLAKLDGRELEWKRDSLKAERLRAAKRRDISMADADTSAAQIARLEMTRLDNQIQLMEHHIANLTISSPIAGVVVAGDLTRSAGSPVQRGQSLFEIAPLDRMRAEVAIPAQDVAYVPKSAEGTISLEAYPGERWGVAIDQIQPRSEVRDGENVFIASIPVVNEDGRLRPGMRGITSVFSSEKPLGWLLFHRAWEQVSLWLDPGGSGRFGFSIGVSDLVEKIRAIDFVQKVSERLNSHGDATR